MSHNLGPTPRGAALHSMPAGSRTLQMPAQQGQCIRDCMPAMQPTRVMLWQEKCTSAIDLSSRFLASPPHCSHLLPSVGRRCMHMAITSCMFQLTHLLTYKLHAHTQGETASGTGETPCAFGANLLYMDCKTSPLLAPIVAAPARSSLSTSSSFNTASLPWRRIQLANFGSLASTASANSFLSQTIL